MPMKNPVHPGRIVRQECLEPLNLSIKDAAKALGVARQSLSRIVNEKAAISPDMAIRLEKAFGGTAKSWLQMQLNYDYARADERRAQIKVERLHL
jgi:addiction module HigA family antidote